jgi:DNA polymerase-1
MQKFLLLDAYNFMHRAYHALPKTFRDQSGAPTNAVYGVTSMLINVLQSVKPEYIAAAVDLPEPTFRVGDFTAYKAQRKPMEEDFSSQIPKVMEIFESFGVRTFSFVGYEADDVIATIAKKFEDQFDFIIVSNDRDLWQLAAEHVMLMVAGTKGDTEWIGKKEAEARMGFDPGLIAEYKGLRGDPSDNIPGVYGVGEKTAAKLIAEYQTLDNLYRNIENVKPDSLKEKLLNCYEQALMSRNLAKLNYEVPIEVNFEDCKYSEWSKIKVRDTLLKYNFKSLIRRLGFEDVSEKSKTKEKPPEDQLALF